MEPTAAQEPKATAQRPGRRFAAAAAFAALASCVLLLFLAPSASAAPPQIWQKCDSDEPAGQQCSSPRGIAANRLTGHVFVADQANRRIVEFDADGGFTRAWGWDVVQSGPGDDTLAPEDEFEICVPEDGDTCKAGVEGTAAGQFASPGGLAVDSAGGVYVVDLGIPSNQRVQKFNRAGEFLLAWGGDVVFSGPDDSGADEQQQLGVAATAGTFRLGLSHIINGGAPQETAALPFNTTAAQIQAALNALPTIGGLGGSVTVTGSNPFTVDFEGNLAGDDVPQLTVALDVGSQLKCSSPTVAESISYQWFKQGKPISGATASTYTATESDKGKAIQCQVTVTNANAGSTHLSNPAQMIAPASGHPVPVPPATIAAPKASAPLTVGGAGGQTLSCDAEEASWKHLLEVWGYRWYRNGVQVKSSGFGGTISSTYEVTAADLASPAVFQCEVTVRGDPPEALEVSKSSENLATVPAPSAPAAPEAQASTSPANATATIAHGGAPEVCKAADACKGGSLGSANGEFGKWAFGSFIAIDAKGTASDADDDVHVGDIGRIQRFDTEGAYQGEIVLPGKTVSSLAVDTAGNLYYGSGAKINKLSPGGAPIPPTFEVPKLAAEVSPRADAVAVDAAGNVYAFGPTGGGIQVDPIFKFDPSGKLLEHFGKNEFNASTGLATNLCPGGEAPGNLYVSNLNFAKGFVRAYGTPPSGCGLAITLPATGIEETAATLRGTVNPNALAVTDCRFEYGLTIAPYENTVPCAESNAAIGTGFEPVPVHADVAGLPAGTVHHFRLVAESAAGSERGSDRTFKTLGPPVIGDSYALGATHSEASLKALVNPEGFPTTYRFEYGLDTAYGKSTPELAIGKDRSDHAVLANLTGLAPGTTYHWRVVATNSSDATVGPDHVLRTYRPFSPETSCPNQPRRSGPSAPLPDCRAYEMVSPVDKNGGDIVSRTGNSLDPGGYMQAAPGGDKITYTSPASFAGQPNSFDFNQYLSGRGAGGWSTQGIHPPVGSTAPPGDSVTRGILREFIAFSRDLCSAWLIDYQSPPPSADGQQGIRNLYRRQNCGGGAGSFEALAPSPPALPEGTPIEYVSDKSVQDVSGSGQHALFVARARLPHVPEAAPGNNQQIYDRFEGGLSLVSVLPDGTANPGSSVVGSGWNGNLDGATSEDGARAYWTADPDIGGSGEIYVREHPEQGIVEGECEAGNACTTRVSGAATSLFWQGSADGTRALYSEASEAGEDLFVFELGGEPPRTKIASDILGVLGASEDLSRIYFASRVAIEGTGGMEGEPNVYLYEEGEGVPSYELVATVGEGDVGAVEPGGTFAAYDLAGAGSESKHTYYRATRVTPDGSTLAFNSRATLTDYDNTDTASGKPAVEVYLYDATADEGAGELHCASCNPSAARPLGQEMSEPYNPRNLRNEVIAAAWIPTWEHPNYASNVLSADGNRLFFNASDALVPRDANGAQDVYQWEAPGTGGCTTSSPSYLPTNGGCLDLISSGQSPHESIFWEASADGRDVFFTTASSLLPQDPGLVDLYDARVGGGFPQPTPKPACEGEACQSPVAPPNDPTPASASFRGPGDPPQSKARKRRCPKGKRRARRNGGSRCVRKRRCPKGKRRARRNGGSRCVKQKARSNRRANEKRGASR